MSNAIEKSCFTTFSQRLPPIPEILDQSFVEIIHKEFVGKAWKPIPETIKNLIIGKSFKEGAVELKDLAYVQITHINAKGCVLQGELIFHKKLAIEIIKIFLELFNAKYPIEQVRLIDYYDANDDLAMKNNCSTALCVRDILGCSGRYSKHSFGIAIDINPIFNPYHKGNVVLPLYSEKYLDRELDEPGLIKEDDACHIAFVSKGYTWGGNWDSLKDYMHFEKDPLV